MAKLDIVLLVQYISWEFRLPAIMLSCLGILWKPVKAVHPRYWK